MTSVIAVTGANGFIGSAFCERAASKSRSVLRIVHRRTAPRQRSREVATPLEANAESLAVDLANERIDDLSRALDGVSSVVHLAGRAHVMDETADDPERAYREANVDATSILARAALAAGVRRFIFASSVKVNGEWTQPGRPFRPTDPVAPQDAYARSKLAAEEVLASVAPGTSAMHVVILRLPLVYGAHARGNFRRLVDAVRAHRWLPLGAVANRRSLLGIDNLLDALDATLDAAPGVGGTHFVADADSVSTPHLIRSIANALETKPRLVPLPYQLLQAAARIAGQQDALDRLTRSLEVDTSSLQAATRWRPRAFRLDADMVRA